MIFNLTNDKLIGIGYVVIILCIIIVIVVVGVTGKKIGEGFKEELVYTGKDFAYNTDKNSATYNYMNISDNTIRVPDPYAFTKN